VEPEPRPYGFVTPVEVPQLRVAGATRQFAIKDSRASDRRWITARLRIITEHAALWVQDGLWHDVRGLQDAAHFFEMEVLGPIRLAFGTEWIPGVDNDPRIQILHVSGLGTDLLGYTSPLDEYLSSFAPVSNEAELIVVNLDAVEIGSPGYYAVLAGQTERLIHLHHDHNEERWIDDGLAGLATILAQDPFSPPLQLPAFEPNVSLTGQQKPEASGQQNPAVLFALFFHQLFGDAGTRALVAQPLNGVAGIEATLNDLGQNDTFEDLFTDWLATNYVDGGSRWNDPSYAYSLIDLPQPRTVARLDAFPSNLESSLHQYAAEYISLAAEHDLDVTFQGVSETPLANLRPHSGSHSWWSNRFNGSQSTLTLAADLSHVDRATVTFWAWYDLEPDSDYVMLEVSTSGGAEWLAIPPSSCSRMNPVGRASGCGYTGTSGEPPDWVRRSADLSAFAGQEIQLRFTYLTDAAGLGPGFFVDDISIPEIGFSDDAEEGSDCWGATGFIRTGTNVEQHYLASVILLGDELRVGALPTQPDRTGHWRVPLGQPSVEEAVLVISAQAPSTLEQAPYELTIRETDEPEP
jgi:immune inhibitor A